MSRVYRIQDREGRGPWRPGLSHRWCDSHLAEGVEDMPSTLKEFGADFLERRRLPREHVGCAVRKVRYIARWVSKTEIERLDALGFRLVSIHPDRILAESQNQIVFACRAPLARSATILPWSLVYLSVGEMVHV